MRGAGRDVWVKIRASEAERAEWHAKARSAGLTLSDLVRRSVGRVHPWTVAHAEVERERTRELARIGANLNQIARWANTLQSERRDRRDRRPPGRHRAGCSQRWPPSSAPTPMHIKFLARGTSSALEAADYLLGARDATGQLREGVEVLRGDPHQVAAVADALAFEHKYTSGVIAWAPDDTPTDALDRRPRCSHHPGRASHDGRRFRTHGGMGALRIRGCRNAGPGPSR